MQFIDLLGQPVSVGDKLLVKGHFSMSLDTVSTVTRINKKSITVEVPTRKLLRRGEYCYVSHTWITPNEYTTVMQSMPRQASECLKLSEEQIDKINYVANQNLNNFLVSDPASHIPEKLTAHSYNLFSDSLYTLKRHYIRTYSEEYSDQITKKVDDIRAAARQQYPEFSL